MLACDGIQRRTLRLRCCHQFLRIHYFLHKLTPLLVSANLSAEYESLLGRFLGITSICRLEMSLLRVPDTHLHLL